MGADVFSVAMQMDNDALGFFLLSGGKQPAMEKHAVAGLEIESLIIYLFKGLGRSVFLFREEKK